MVNTIIIQLNKGQKRRRRVEIILDLSCLLPITTHSEPRNIFGNIFAAAFLPPHSVRRVIHNKFYLFLALFAAQERRKA